MAAAQHWGPLGFQHLNSCFFSGSSFMARTGWHFRAGSEIIGRKLGKWERGQGTKDGWEGRTSQRGAEPITEGWSILHTGCRIKYTPA